MKIAIRLFTLSMLLAVASSLCLAQTAPAASTDAPATKAAKKKTPPMDPSTIAQAPGGGGGKVWVNTSSKVFHKEGDPWYGKTKHGQYMTEADATKAGFKEAKMEDMGKKKDAMSKDDTKK